MLDEPTTGLHFDDTKRLIKVLNRLVDNGNTVYIIEHNLDVIKSCDYLIDLGPEGGAAGGQLLAEGTPETVAKVPDSYTGMFLEKMFHQKAKDASAAIDKLRMDSKEDWDGAGEIRKMRDAAK